MCNKVGLLGSDKDEFASREKVIGKWSDLMGVKSTDGLTKMQYCLKYLLTQDLECSHNYGWVDQQAEQDLNQN